MPELRRKNKAILNQSKEADLHFIVKVLLWKKCIEKGHQAVTEFKLGKKIVDVIDDTNRVLYEVEKHPTPKYRQTQLAIAEKLDAVSYVIDLTKDIPDDVKKSIEKLAKYLDTLIP